MNNVAVDKLTEQLLEEVLKRLKMQNVSFYKLAKKIQEPESTLHNIFKSRKKYSIDKVRSVSKKIIEYLDSCKQEETELEKLLTPVVPEDWSTPFRSIGNEDIYGNIETYVKLYEVGLNSRTFTPAEKLHLATMYKNLSDFKNQNNNSDETPSSKQKRNINKSAEAAGETIRSPAGVAGGDT